MGGRPPISVTREQGWGGFWDPPGTESRCTLGREGALQAQKEHPGAPPNLDGEAATPTPRLPLGRHQLSLRKETTSQFGRLAYQ